MANPKGILLASFNLLILVFKSRETAVTYERRSFCFAHLLNPTGSVSKRGYSPAVGGCPASYFIWFVGIIPLHFQSAYFCLGLMVFAAFFLEREGCVFSSCDRSYCFVPYNNHGHRQLSDTCNCI